MIKFLATLMWLLNSLVCRTLRYRIIGEVPKRNALFALWHGQNFPLFYWARCMDLLLLPIDNWRGDILDFLAKQYGYETVRLPVSGTPFQHGKSIIKLIETLKEGQHIALAVDGPPPPHKNHKAKAGILYLAEKTSHPIVPVGIKMMHSLKLFWRWDKYEIPLPFSEVRIAFGDHLFIAETIKPEELPKMVGDLEERIRLTELKAAL